MNDSHYIIHTDGGSRGNPGPAASGYVIDGPDIARFVHGDFLGKTTNNVAEYTAAINALIKLKTILGPTAAQAEVTVKSDSELLVKQVNGLYKVKDPQLAQLFIRLHNARQDFAKVDFIHIRREQNAVADGAVNAALDAQLSS